MRRLSIALLLITSTASAENWVQVSEVDSDGDSLLVDMSGVTQSGDARTAWSKSVHNLDQPIQPGFDRAPDTTSYRWELTLNNFNCAKRMTSKAQTLLLSADNKVVGRSSVVQRAPKPRKVSRGSDAEKMLDMVCSAVVPPAPPSETGKPPPARMIHAVNPDDYFPRSAINRGVSGSPVLKVCVGPTGAPLREPEVTDSSGVPELDAAGVAVAKANRYGAAIENGVAVAESCIKFKVKFVVFDH